MPEWRAYPSGFTTGVNALPDAVVDPVESIGLPSDARATANNDTNSFLSILKGIAASLGVSAGDGSGTTNTAPKVFGDLEVTLGQSSDAIATDNTGRWSAMSLLKAAAGAVGIPA